VQAARHLGGVLARERDLERIRRARGVARGEQAAEGLLAPREPRLQRAAVGADALQLGLRAAPLGLELAQRAVGFRDRALGVAQRVARLAPVGLPVAQLALQRLDARAQRGEVLLAARLRRRAGGQQQREREEADQAFAFPWAETAATRRSTSAASPR
jgi:hypothetical protein